MKNKTLPTIFLALIFAGCGKSPPETESSHEALTESQVEQSVVIGEQASTSLMKSLGAQLKGALSGGDPRAAVRVCQQVAQPITTSTAEQFSGVTVSRTSLKTRNPVNVPDESDRPILEKWQALADGGESLPEHEVVQGDGETAIYYRPIMVQELCVKCHGGSENLSPGIRSVLDRLYPNDNARGYEVGDFRGAFRVTIDLTALEQGADQAR